MPCQLRAICEFSSEPGNYFPLSDVILSELKESPGWEATSANQTSNAYSETTSLFHQFSTAADNGMMFGTEKCVEIYGRNCKYPTEKLLNMPVLKFWNNVQSKLQLKFESTEQ